MSTDRSDVILERMMSLHPKIIDLTLDRMWRLLAALGNPQDTAPPMIHVAGTNGKGSTQAMIRAGLEATGRVTHAYTSPHLARFHERIRIAGTLIDEGALSDVLEECEAANGGEPITYFEITTAAAFLAFARTPADYVLLEVGLGGRLDATNVIERPALCVITPVSIDHQQFLGETVAEIASEKAGILKRGVPCIVGPQTEGAMEVIEAQAARVGAPLIAQGQHWHVRKERGRLVYEDETGLCDLPAPVLPGPHQFDNAGAAIAALRHLQMGDAALDAAVTGAMWPARMQRLRKGSLVEAANGAELWLDGGHNVAAGAAIAETLASLPARPTHVICGMLNTKDVTGFLAPIAGQADSLIAVAIPGEPNALAPADIIAASAGAGLPAQAAETVEDALAAILSTTPQARVLICGSLYLAGAVLRENG